MAIYKGNTKIVKLYKGNTQIVKRYKGTDLIYSASRLPSAFQEVEYLQSSGTQYIDSGIALTSTTGVKLDAQFTLEDNGVLIGVLEPNVGRFQPYFIENRIIKACYEIANNQLIVSTTQGSNRNTYEFNITNNDIKFNGSRVGTVGNIGSTTNTIYIFARNYSSNIFCVAKLYSLQLYDNGILTRDFVPCYRKADNVAGLYDLVNGVFYTNAGTGTFIVGGNI